MSSRRTTRSKKKAEPKPEAEKTVGDRIEEIIESAEAERPHAGQFLSAETVQAILKAIEVIALAGIYSPVSQLTLSPVYGTVQTELFHRHGMMVAALAAWLGRSYLERLFPRNAAAYLPALAFLIPTIQFFLFQQSSKIPSPYGPIVTELFTFYPLVLLSVYSAAQLAETIDLSGFGQRFAEHAPPLISYLVFSAAEKVAQSTIYASIGSSIVMTRTGLQFIIATLYGLVFPSKLLLLTIPSLLFSALYNVHIPLPQNTALLNSTLMENNWIVHARKESNTGYISVLENLESPYRVMRCDHSLLGGEWTKFPAGYGTPVLGEPIYGIFVMLEAVRLVETANKKSRIADKDAHALVM